MWRSSAHTAPGRSQFKMCVVQHCGQDAKAAMVAIVNAMLRTQLVPQVLKEAQLIWTSKHNGGVRGISLLEEIMKALEAIVANRIEAAMASLPLGAVLSSSNVGFQKGRGAELVLAVVQDFLDQAREQGQPPMSLLPWDVRSFFDEIDVAVPDAVMQSRGLPEDAAGLLVELHTAGATLRALTPWGCTPPVLRRTGVHQGGCSAPLLSRFAGEIIARSVDAHPHAARIGGGRAVSTQLRG